jgi:tRNA G18 (ribose-2'-O)-methylase SpoU
VDLAAVSRQLECSPRKVAVLLGTEGAGLSQRWSSTAGVRATIPMRAGIDSLNVAAATAIACYSLGPRSSSSSASGILGVTGQSSG